MNNDFERQSFIPSNDDYQETLQEEQLAGDGTTSPSSQRWFSNSNLLRRGSSGASFQEGSSTSNRDQASIHKHRSFGAAQTNRSQQQQQATSSNNSGWSSSNFSSASQPTHSFQPSSQVNSISSYQYGDSTQGGTSSSHVFVDSLSYEDLTAMLNSSWEVSSVATNASLSLAPERPSHDSCFSF